MSIAIRVETRPADIIGWLKNCEKNIKDAVDDEIYFWLMDLRTYALANKPWRDRTYTLRRSHKIEGGDDGWELVVDTRLEGADINYGYILENYPHLFSRSYTWIQPAVEAMKPELTTRLIDAVNDAIKKGEKEAGKKSETTLIHVRESRQKKYVKATTGIMTAVTEKPKRTRKKKK